MVNRLIPSKIFALRKDKWNAIVRFDIPFVGEYVPGNMVNALKAKLDTWVPNIVRIHIDRRTGTGENTILVAVSMDSNWSQQEMYDRLQRIIDSNG